MLYFTTYPGHRPHLGGHARPEGLRGRGVRGIGSIPGAVIGAFLIGICENFVKILPFEGATTFVDAFTFALLIIVLVFKPTGLFGKRPPTRSKGGSVNYDQERKAERAPWPA